MAGIAMRRKSRNRARLFMNIWDSFSLISSLDEMIRARISSTVREMEVASATPGAPSFGAPKRPKINTAFNRIFSVNATVFSAVLIIALVILVILGFYCLLILFRHRGRRDKFVMQKTENGELSISLKAMESMVQKCLLTVDALQQQIKQYVTACSGVEVKDIRVQIESSGPEATESLYAIEAPTARALPSSGVKEEKPVETVEEKVEEITPEELESIAAEIPKPEPAEAEGEAEPEEPAVVVPEAAVVAAEQLKKEAPEEDDDRPMHQRLFSSYEEPCVMPMPPEKEEITEAAAEEAEKAVEETAEAAEEKAEEKPEEEKKEGSEDK